MMMMTDVDDCRLILRQKSSMHSMLVAPGREDIKRSKLKKSITNFREDKKEEEKKGKKRLKTDFVRTGHVIRVTGWLNCQNIGLENQ